MTMEQTFAPEETVVNAPEAQANIEVSTQEEAMTVEFTDHQDDNQPSLEVPQEVEPQVDDQATTEDGYLIFEDEEGNEFYQDENGEYIPLDEGAEHEDGEQYVNPQVAEYEAQIIDMHRNQIFGSEEAYAQATQWGADNLNEAEQSLYNRVMEEGTPAEVAFAMKALSALYGAQQPQAQPMVRDGRQVQPSGTAYGGLQGFNSDIEMAAAMADPRYQRADAIGDAYRAEVMNRLSISNF